MSAGHDSIVELISFLPSGAGLEIAKLIVQQNSSEAHPPQDAIGQTLCSLLVSSDKKSDVLKWIKNDKSELRLLEENTEQSSGVSCCLCDGELVALLVKAVLIHKDFHQLDKILALLLHEHIMMVRCVAAYSLELIAGDILTQSSCQQALKYSMPLFQKTHKLLSAPNDRIGQFLQHVPVNLASQLLKHCVASLNVTCALIAKNLVTLYKHDKSFVSDALVALQSYAEQALVSDSEDEETEKTDSKTLFLSILAAVLSVCDKDEENCKF